MRLFLLYDHAGNTGQKFTGIYFPGVEDRPTGVKLLTFQSLKTGENSGVKNPGKVCEMSLKKR